MSKVDTMRLLVNQRLTAAAEEIFELFERTIAEYEEQLRGSKEENQRQQKLLDSVLSPVVRLHRADVQQLLEIKEEVPPEQLEKSSGLDQEDFEPPPIKVEQEELWSSQEGEQLQGLEEDISTFVPPVPVKREDDGEKPQSSQLHEDQTEENGLKTSQSSETDDSSLEYEAVDDSGMPGMDRVDRLAECLVELRNQPSLTLTNQQVSSIVALWQNLLDYDRQRVVFAARHQSRLDAGRFRSPKKRQEFTPGGESLKRHALTTTAPLAQWPDCCRLIETIFIRLCAIHRSPKKRGTGTVSRWDLILEDYRKIRRLILASGAVMQLTTMQLVDVSHTTVVQWHNKRVKRQDNAVLRQGLNLPSRLSSAADSLFPANVRLQFAPPPPGPAHHYPLPESTVGQAMTKRRRLFPAASAAPAVAQRQIFPVTTLVPQLHPQQQFFLAPPSVPRLHPQQQFFLAPPSVPQQLFPLRVAAPGPAAPTAAATPPVRRRVTRRAVHNTCKKCGQFRTVETGHSQYKGTIYCPSVETMPKEQWLEQMKQ
ncbi:uncharacterized protein LOC117828055 isoform X1 [Notolabrus celidotus]|uniref:uncharacterized protein LOC117828055 isoform X1 n=1 Tax=Notolabrus celidotus TaxID=1203425 RepID=UPI00148FC0DC|nr:uncharacterized protein LOC117828055 isoform X1 [Notolabrus celidotus]